MKFSQLLVLIWSISTPLVVETSVNLALGKPTSQSSDFNARWDSSKAVDGCSTQTIASDCCTHTEIGVTEVWWQVDLQQQSVIESVYIIYRNEGTLYRLAGFEIYLSYTSDWRKGVRCYKDYTDNLQSMSATQNVSCSGVARYVTIYNDRRMKSKSWYSDDAVLDLCEVNVYECSPGFSGTYCRCPLNCKDASCPLPTGYCTECFDSFYGDRCNLTCPSNCLTNVCARSNGQCTACKPGFFGTHCRCPANCRDQTCPGDYCNECDIGYYGIRCDLVCPNNCDNMGCNRTSGECIGCVLGYFGSTCDQTCPSNCNDNLCVQANGVCIGCKQGFFGNTCNSRCPLQCKDNTCIQSNGHCEECEAGFHGRNCTKICPNSCRDHICEQVDGRCTECKFGFFGHAWLDMCGYCQDENCDKDTGSCLSPFANGLTDDKCDVRRTLAIKI
ncbi:protein draper-like [Ylistrum balloti]|uniref:protein draper-like n=1 Tax=Ylistrum balloti TaxID=509963 RepID=UPI002905ECDD|nr:protein draper-like [Ylistrum balloti]